MVSRHSRFVLVLLLGLVALGVAHWGLRETEADLAARIHRLIDQLAEPGNKVRIALVMIPGGELLDYSPPMLQLIKLGDAARGPLHERLYDEQVRNEVAVILGSVGDESTVALLINAYPDVELQGEQPAADELDPARFTIMCFTHALTALTHQDISRSRTGTEYSPDNRKKWQAWWAQNHQVFWVTGEPPRATFIPGTPEAPRTLKTAPQVLAQLNKALEDEDPEVRTSAAYAYGRLGPKATESVPNLVRALRDQVPSVREAAAHSFYWIGPSGADAIPSLLGVMRHDPVEKVRANAAYALSNVDPQAAAKTGER